MYVFFVEAEGGIRDSSVTGVQTCALPICPASRPRETVSLTIRLRPFRLRLRAARTVGAAATGIAAPWPWPAAKYGPWLHACSSAPGRVTSALPAMLHGCHAGRRILPVCGC